MNPRVFGELLKALAYDVERWAKNANEARVWAAVYAAAPHHTGATDPATKSARAVESYREWLTADAEARRGEPGADET